MIAAQLDRRRWPAAVVAAALTAVAAPAVAAPGGLTVEEAVELALRANPRLAAARARIEASADRTASAGRRMLPVVRVSDELLRYDSPFAITFGPNVPAVVARE